MSSQLETIINAYKTLAKIPSVVSGRLTNNGKRVISKWSIRNLDKSKTTKYNLEYFLDDNLKVVAQSAFGTDVSNELLSSISPLETYRAVIREEKDKKDAKKQYLEVWSRNNLEHSIDLTALDIHGDVYADSEFGGLNWSSDESAVVYVAERKLPKFEPYIKRKNEDKSKTDGSGEAKDAPRKGEEFLYRQDWGEQLVGKYLSVIVVCELQTEKVTVLEGLPESWCPGQVRFAPDGKSVFGVAWETEPRRLGLIFCTNRPSVIFSLTLDGNLTKVSADGLSVRSPRFNANGDLFWLQRSSGGPHHACHELKRKGETGITTVIPIVDSDMKIGENQQFYGLYCQALPSRCFTSDGRIVFSTPQKNEIRSYISDPDGGRIVDISNRTGSTSLLDVRGCQLLAVCSDLNTPPQLYTAKLPAAGQESRVEWIRISQPTAAPESVSKAKVEYLELEHKDSKDDVKSFTAIYFAPVSDKKLPLIVWPHGGPHSGFVNAFSIEAAMHAMLGLASVRINYRGSVGHGDRNLRSLLGKSGTIDVDDCLLTITSLEEAIDNSRVFLYGGSYGGFINAHLAGRYPDKFKAVVLRNPLIDLASKGHYADNSDGCAVEAGFEFKESGPVSEEELLAMRRCSPLAHVHKVKAPTALMLGSGDKRVPHYQGLEYARRLKANGVATRVYMYDDNHSLSSPAAEMDNLINGMHWFLQHFP
ncbi:acylamino-acid-releasing enzyme-like isoform X2 [Plodia interpunctella]|uniref:acylamino-acid-releasing enzyme-like isoform X2 n=1 Tax=Plodia interpunctella TaxID=58824 RepID=UPI00236755EB|nr:acylamino-acid-releasing enzyme-like isoform X2 [Plodia interpunctella]